MNKIGKRNSIIKNLKWKGSMIEVMNANRIQLYPQKPFFVFLFFCFGFSDIISNRLVIGSTPVGRTRNFFPSLPMSLTEKTSFSLFIRIFLFLVIFQIFRRCWNVQWVQLTSCWKTHLQTSSVSAGVSLFPTTLSFHRSRFNFPWHHKEI